ncbi:hypothetical protein V6N13_064482 [Hibiscus sabdariffa]
MLFGGVGILTRGMLSFLITQPRNGIWCQAFEDVANQGREGCKGPRTAHDRFLLQQHSGNKVADDLAKLAYANRFDTSFNSPSQGESCF